MAHNNTCIRNEIVVPNAMTFSSHFLFSQSLLQLYLLYLSLTLSTHSTHLALTTLLFALLLSLTHFHPLLILSKPNFSTFDCSSHSFCLIFSANAISTRHELKSTPLTGVRTNRYHFPKTAVLCGRSNITFPRIRHRLYIYPIYSSITITPGNQKKVNLFAKQSYHNHSNEVKPEVTLWKIKCAKSWNAVVWSAQLSEQFAKPLFLLIHNVKPLFHLPIRSNDYSPLFIHIWYIQVLRFHRCLLYMHFVSSPHVWYIKQTELNIINRIFR